MDGRRRRTFLVGILGALVVFGLLLGLVGARSVVAAVLRADPVLVAVTFALAFCWLVAWSLMLRTAMRALDVELAVGTSFLVYSGVVFANNVTPFGQAGGEPIAALLVSKVSDTRYETGLVGIASVDVCNVIPSVSLAVVGVAVFATTGTVDGRLEDAIVTAVVLLGCVGLFLVLAWRYRQAAVERIPPVVVPRIASLTRGRFDSETVEEQLVARARRFFENVERVATDRWRLSGVLGLSLLGWLFQVAALYVAFAALGYAVSPAVLLFAIPLGYLAGATPLPGGLGGIEAALVALLVPTTGIAASAVTAAVLVFRAAVYWMPILIGGGSLASLGIRGTF